MATHTLTLTVEQYGVTIELPLVVEYSVHRPQKGRREAGTGLQLEPDDPSGIEIEQAWVQFEMDGIGNEGRIYHCIDVSIDDEDELRVALIEELAR